MNYVTILRKAVEVSPPSLALDMFQDAWHSIHVRGASVGIQDDLLEAYHLLLCILHRRVLEYRMVVEKPTYTISDHDGNADAVYLNRATLDRIHGIMAMWPEAFEEDCSSNHAKEESEEDELAEV